MAGFNYTQLNIVGRDEVKIKAIVDAINALLDKFISRADVNGKNFQNIVKTADEVWSGDDKEAFVKNFKDKSKKYVSDLKQFKSNLIKYTTQDINDFNSLQKKTTGITTK